MTIFRLSAGQLRQIVLDGNAGIENRPFEVKMVNCAGKAMRVKL